MIHHYGIKLRGASHKEGSIPCQDAFVVDSRSNDFVIAAVADGLGSAEHSDIASQMAVDTSTRYCARHITQESDANEILRTIKASFFEALDKIEETVKLNDRELAQYHTTLSLAVLLGDTLYYGHSGDSGIVALTLEGTFEKVTEQQRDEDNNVFPLFFESRWVFGQFEKKACSVLLATDGMLMRLFPLLLRDESVNLRVNEMGYLMDNQCLHIDKEGTNAVKARVENYVKDNIPHEDVGSDDITIVVLVNTSIKPGEQPASYYKEPDWAELARKRDEEYERLAYPGRSDKTKAGQGPASANTSEKNSSGKRVSPDSFPADNKTATVLQESSKADTKDAISKTSNQVEQESTVTKSRWNFWG